MFVTECMGGAKLSLGWMHSKPKPRTKLQIYYYRLERVYLQLLEYTVELKVFR